MRLLSWLGLLLWLSYGVTLWPLPPHEVAETVAMYERLMAEPSPLEQAEWKSRPALEQEEGERKYREFLQTAKEIIERSGELKGQLWLEWAGRAGLLCVAVLAWLYLIKLPRISIAAIAITTGTLIVVQIVSHWAVYSELVQAWGAGYSGVKYLPSVNVLLMLYLLFALPIILVVATALAFRSRPLQEAQAK